MNATEKNASAAFTVDDLAAELAVESLKKGCAFSFFAEGDSMRPFLHSGDQLTITPLCRPPRIGEVVLCHIPPFGFVHRVTDTDSEKGVCLQGDNLANPDGWFAPHQIIGKVTYVRRDGRRVPLLDAPVMVHFCAQLRRIRRSRSGAMALYTAGRVRRLADVFRQALQGDRQRKRSDTHR